MAAEGTRRPPLVPRPATEDAINSQTLILQSKMDWHPGPCDAANIALYRTGPELRAAMAQVSRLSGKDHM